VNDVELDVQGQVARIVELIQNIKGENISVLDIRKVTSIADYFILVTARANTQVKGIADEITTKLKEENGIAAWHVEGYQELSWVLIDYVHIVVHIFDQKTREYYALENLWKDAVVQHIKPDFE
jgi:ribosome-associated protein